MTWGATYDSYMIHMITVISLSSIDSILIALRFEKFNKSEHRLTQMLTHSLTMFDTSDIGMYITNITNQDIYIIYA